MGYELLRVLAYCLSFHDDLWSLCPRKFSAFKEKHYSLEFVI